MNVFHPEIKESIKRIRTSKGIVDHFRKTDPETAITEHFIRQLIIMNKIPVIHAGSKKLVAIEDVETYFKYAAK